MGIDTWPHSRAVPVVSKLPACHSARCWTIANFIVIQGFDTHLFNLHSTRVRNAVSGIVCHVRNVGGLAEHDALAGVGGWSSCEIRCGLYGKLPEPRAN